MCHANKETRKTEGIELPNQEKIRTIGGKENYKYLGILEADTVKQDRNKRKMNKNSILEEKENFWKPSSTVEISSKE